MKNNDEHVTPSWIMRGSRELYNPLFDVCATVENQQCEWYFDKRMDSLSFGWTEWVRERFIFPQYVFWMHPPASLLPQFVKKAYEESQKGSFVICYLPSHTASKWWHDYVMRAGLISFILGDKRRHNGKLSHPGCIVEFGTILEGDAPRISAENFSEYHPKKQKKENL